MKVYKQLLHEHHEKKKEIWEELYYTHGEELYYTHYYTHVMMNIEWIQSNNEQYLVPSFYSALTRSFTIQAITAYVHYVVNAI
mgnify:CR=1 FL=1